MKEEHREFLHRTHGEVDGDPGAQDERHTEWGRAPAIQNGPEVQMAFQQAVRMDQMMVHMNQVEQNMQGRTNNIEGALTMIVSREPAARSGLQQNSPSCQ